MFIRFSFGSDLWKDGIKCNPEVGVWNSELIGKENFRVLNSPFRIPKSSFTEHSIIPSGGKPYPQAYKFCWLERDRDHS
jgi:hypothetical protein